MAVAVDAARQRLDEARQEMATGSARIAAQKADEAAIMFARVGEAAASVAALCEAVGFRIEGGDAAEAARVACEEVERRQKAGDEPGEATVLLACAAAQKALGDAAASRALAARAVELRRRLGGGRAVAEALRVLAEMQLARSAYAEAQPREALRAAYEAMAAFRAEGAREEEAAVLLVVAEARLELGYASEGASAAMEALGTFRALGHLRGLQDALAAIVRSYVACFQAPRALDVAQRERALARERGDKACELAATRALKDVYVAMGKAADALGAAQEAAVLSRELKDREATELLAISDLHRASGMPASAQQAAEQALIAARNAGDAGAEERARRLLSQMHVESGRPQAAPNREAALSALRALAAAVEARHGEDFKRALASLDELAGFTEEDVQEVLVPVFERDRQGAARFLKLMDFDSRSGSSTMLRQFYKGDLYLGFRAGGLGYGPRFRNCQPQQVARPGGRVDACATLQVYDDQEEWGKNLCYHPGILDSMQHTTNALFM